MATTFKEIISSPVTKVFKVNKEAMVAARKRNDKVLLFHRWKRSCKCLVSVMSIIDEWLKDHAKWVLNDRGELPTYAVNHDMNRGPGGPGAPTTVVEASVVQGGVNGQPGITAQPAQMGGPRPGVGGPNAAGAAAIRAAVVASAQRSAAEAAAAAYPRQMMPNPGHPGMPQHPGAPQGHPGLR